VHQNDCVLIHIVDLPDGAMPPPKVSIVPVLSLPDFFGHI